MQSALSPGMHPASSGNHPLALQGEWEDGAERPANWRERIDPDGPLAAALAIVDAKNAPRSHSVVWLGEGSERLGACDCGYCTEMEPTHDAVRDMTVHQVWQANCTRTASAVGGVR